MSTDLMNMARGMNPSKLEKKFTPPENATILACPTCGSRHGGEISDTEYISWRCRKCRKYIYGKVANGLFILMAASNHELPT